MIRRAAIPVVLAALAWPAVPASGQSVEWWTDFAGDAVARATSDPGAPLNPATVLPDVTSLSLSGWSSPTAATDPYSGIVVPGETAGLFRLDLVFAGLVNPPGPLSSGEGFDAFRYGPSPVYGFLELDVDGDHDTGGELGGAARTRYLANVGRFGRLPDSSVASRTAVWGTNLDGVFATAPQYERSGADFVLSFCGCYAVSIVSEGGNGNGRFEAGETWIVRSAFFQRAGGYKDGCFSFGGVSGVPGMYDPPVNLRFSHDAATNRTTVTLVYALNMAGAAQLAGQSQQPVNYSVADHTSVREALQDIIDGAPLLVPQTPVWQLARRWGGRSVHDYLDPTDWEATALFGTSYATAQPSNFVWTDTGFDEVAGDVSGDGECGTPDADLVRQTIDTLDGGPLDAEGGAVQNGSVGIIGFGPNFCVYDVDGSGAINFADLRYYCFGDFNRDGLLNVIDFVAFSTGYAGGDPRADIDRNGRLDVNDYVGFGNAFAGGCQ